MKPATVKARFSHRFGIIAAGCVLVLGLGVSVVLPNTYATERPLPKPETASSLPANQLFGARQTPSDEHGGRAFGSYARGCLAGAQMLPVTGPHWQAMRLSRNRNWGHPALLDYIEKLARDAQEKDGWPGLLVGDISQPRGGPMLTGHASHQIGLDVDIWLMPAPERKLTHEERERISAISVVKDRHRIDPKVWTEAHAKLLRRAASYPEVERIFVHPPIKKALCDWATGDRSWLRKIRAWYGHTYHMHIRIACPDDSPGCVDQAPPPPGDGCGAELNWWLSDKPWAPADPSKPAPERHPLLLRDLPAACGAVLASD